ncbi:MAG: metal-dependent transcriptional regulator [Prolixibacteraceae bacterium]|jgi:DtxR family Mn-dependent transcriptional regulator
MASQTEENYLKSLFTLANDKEGVNASELSNLLKVSLPTVNSMAKNLQKQGLVNYEKYRPLSLTEKGKKEAALVLRKHRLTEMYLVEKMGFGWEVVHEIAEQVEHVDSSIFFEKMDELLGFPTIDPHGSPIPDKNGSVSGETFEKLSSCKAGEQVQLTALLHSSTEFLKYLTARDLILGTELKIHSVETYDNSMIVSYANHESETLSHVVCDQILVRKNNIVS